MSSTARAICRECGATFRPETAAETGGLCLACVHGYRHKINATLAYRRGRREHEMLRDHWRHLVHIMYLSPDAYYRRSAPEQAYFAVGLLNGEVHFGGTRHYFWNLFADYFPEAQRGLEEMGAQRSLGLMRAACQELFPEGGPPSDVGLRRGLMRPASQVLGTIDLEFRSDPDHLDERLLEYVLRHYLVRWD